MTENHSFENCGDCPLPSRRAFVRDLALAAAALAALGTTAAATPVYAMSALSADREEATYPFPASDGVYIDKKEEVIVARVGSQVYAFMLACPHQNTALRWNASEHKFQCPKHHSEYKPDGTYIDGRATRSMDRFAVRKAGNTLVVNLDKVFEDDRDHAGWLAATVTA